MVSKVVGYTLTQPEGESKWKSSYPPGGGGWGEGLIFHGPFSLCPNIWVGKHAPPLLLRPVLNTSDRVVLKTEFKSWWDDGNLTKTTSEVGTFEKNPRLVRGKKKFPIYIINEVKKNLAVRFPSGTW